MRPTARRKGCHFSRMQTLSLDLAVCMHVAGWSDVSAQPAADPARVCATSTCACGEAGTRLTLGLALNSGDHVAAEGRSHQGGQDRAWRDSIDAYA